MNELGPLRSRADDERLLAILDAIYRDGLRGADLRERFGTSNGALAGIRNRYRQNVLPCHCKKPENKDGGMPEGWWRK